MNDLEAMKNAAALGNAFAVRDEMKKAEPLAEPGPEVRRDESRCGGDEPPTPLL